MKNEKEMQGWLRETIKKEELTGLDNSFTEAVREQRVSNGSYISSLGDEENAKRIKKGKSFHHKRNRFRENTKSLLSSM